MTIRKAKHGDDHPDVATTLNNMANVYKNKADFDKALEYYTSALIIKKAKHGDDHPDEADMLDDVGEMYYVQRVYDRAHMSFKSAADISKSDDAIKKYTRKMNSCTIIDTPDVFEANRCNIYEHDLIKMYTSPYPPPSVAIECDLCNEDFLCANGIYHHGDFDVCNRCIMNIIKKSIISNI